MKEYIKTANLKQCPGCKFAYKREQGCRHMTLEVSEALDLIHHAQSGTPSTSPRHLRRAIQKVDEAFGTSPDNDESSDESKPSSSTRRLLFQDRISPRNNQPGNRVDVPPRSQETTTSDPTRFPVRGPPPYQVKANMSQDGPALGRDAAQKRPTPYQPRMDQATPEQPSSEVTTRDGLGLTRTFDGARQSGSTGSWYPNPLNNQRPHSLGLVGGFGVQPQVQTQRLSGTLQSQEGFQTHSVYEGIAHPAPFFHHDLQGSIGGQGTNNYSQDSRKRPARELSDGNSSFVPDRRPPKTRNRSSVGSSEMIFELHTDSHVQRQQTVPPMQPGQMVPTEMPGMAFFYESYESSATIVSAARILPAHLPYGQGLYFQQQPPSQGLNWFQAPSPGGQVVLKLGLGEARDVAEDEVMDEAVEKGPDSDDRWNAQLGPDFGAKVWGSEGLKEVWSHDSYDDGYHGVTCEAILHGNLIRPLSLVFDQCDGKDTAGKDTARLERKRS
ncbi:hypothetical protein MCOR34_007023 [Pyricularia oryzae]|nr:hypothetical protein MCOR34_007023 [Pyricularia oryzae]KAI6347120.1 hypothetical protein MCOR30_000438 [Pyricularia oryzae]